MSKTNTKVTSIDDVQDDAPVADVQDVHVSDHNDAFSGDKVTLVIHQGEGEIGSQPIFLQVNGANVLIPRGVEVKIAAELKHALDNAVYSVYEGAKDGSTKERKVKRFNYSVIQLHPAKSKAKSAD